MARRLVDQLFPDNINQLFPDNINQLFPDNIEQILYVERKDVHRRKDRFQMNHFEVQNLRHDRSTKVDYLAQDLRYGGFKVDYLAQNLRYGGFKVVYLAQDLTDVELDLMSCSKCLGLVRDATSCNGEIMCLICNSTRGNPLTKVSASVINLKIKCPLLRDCKWTGKILEGEKHLKECGSFLVICPLECGTVIKRCEKNDHTKNHCPLRKVNCKYCDIKILFKDLTEHLKVCPAHPIKCKCGSGMCRGELANHIRTECPSAEVECPYAKYSCKIWPILRKDLLAHKKEFYIEHQDMLEHNNYRLEEECNRLRKSLAGQKDLEGVEFKIDYTNQCKSQTENFRMGSYEFSCKVITCDSYLHIYLTRLPSSFGNDINIICITECRILLEETETCRIPFFWKEKLYSKMTTNSDINLPRFGEDIYKRYIQPDGKLHLKISFDCDYITYKGYF